MLSCVIIDDDPFAGTHLKRLIISRNDLYVNRIFLNATDAIDFLSDHHIDIVFLDIYMPELLGTVVAKLLYGKTLVIFTTNSKQHAIEAFEINAVDYLLKPIDANRFNTAVDKAQILVAQKQQVATKPQQADNKRSITIVSDRKIFKILSQDIYYIESLHEYVCYYTTKGKLLSLGALKDVAEMLSENEFTRIHKSYIINIHHLVNYTALNVVLSNGIELPVGRVYKQHFKESISKL